MNKTSNCFVRIVKKNFSMIKNGNKVKSPEVTKQPSNSHCQFAMMFALVTCFVQ